jgi:ABC-2 type transport system ATP-binding protein
MPQQGGLPMGLTVAETIELFAALHDSPVDRNELLELTGLTSLASRRWRRLSGGEQQRLSLAIALCGGDDLLILDEPTAAVDPDGRARILALITERAKAGSTVLMTTHRFDDVEQVADHVIMMDRGRIVADESLSSLTADDDHIRFSAPTDLDVSELTELVGPTRQIRPGRFEVVVPAEPANVGAIVNWLTARDITPEQLEAGRTSLESRFHELTGRPPADEPAASNSEGAA